MWLPEHLPSSLSLPALSHFKMCCNNLLAFVCECSNDLIYAWLMVHWGWSAATELKIGCLLSGYLTGNCLLPIWPSCPDSPSAEGLTAYCSPSYPLSAHSCLSSQLNFLLSQAMCVKQKQQVSYILTMSHVTLINKLGNEEWSRWNKYLGWGKLLENGITSKVRGMQRAGFHKGLIWVWYKTMLHVWPDDKVSYWTCT